MEFRVNGGDSVSTTYLGMVMLTLLAYLGMYIFKNKPELSAMTNA